MIPSEHKTLTKEHSACNNTLYLQHSVWQAVWDTHSLLVLATRNGGGIACFTWALQITICPVLVQTRWGSSKWSKCEEEEFKDCYPPVMAFVRNRLHIRGMMMEEKTQWAGQGNLLETCQKLKSILQHLANIFAWFDVLRVSRWAVTGESHCLFPGSYDTDKICFAVQII